MEEIVFNKNEIESCGIEITSVSSFIDEVNKLKDDLSGSNEELFFRGQKTDFWDIKPSIFRDYSLSVEHTLMQVPLLKVPHEFKSINNDFEIMTKYQRCLKWIYQRIIQLSLYWVSLKKIMLYPKV